MRRNLLDKREPLIGVSDDALKRGGLVEAHATLLFLGAVTFGAALGENRRHVGFEALLE